MLTFPLVLLATVGLALPGTATGADTDVSLDAVAELATSAHDAVANERALLEAGVDPADPRLAEVDRLGRSLLADLDALDVDVSQAIRVTLDTLPATGSGFVPSSTVYQAAEADLARIAATPEAAMAPEPTMAGPALGLLAIAAMSLLALGAAALGNALRRRESDEELAAMAWSDGLTGLANRRRLDHDVAGHDHDGGPVAVLMIDVDHFKDVNDNFGHQVGDHILREIADMLSGQVRLDDVVYRYGGEEFTILLPGASTADAVQVGQRIVDAAHDVILPDGSNITVSVGVGHAPDPMSPVPWESADRALRAAKLAGRDQVVDASTMSDVDPVEHEAHPPLASQA